MKKIVVKYRQSTENIHGKKHWHCTRAQRVCSQMHTHSAILEAKCTNRMQFVYIYIFLFCLRAHNIFVFRLFLR